MRITPTYVMPRTEEEQAEQERLEAQAAASRKLAAEAQAEAEARANGQTVSLSDRSLAALAIDDQRLRRNIQWGIVRGLFLYSLLMFPVALILAMIETAMNH